MLGAWQNYGRSHQHENEPHRGDLSSRLNWLRAGVLGANDGIVSVAAIVVGVAGATTQTGPILTAGMAGLVGGAVSMALGEYVSVSSQSDSQRALIEKERRELAEQPEAELAELAAIYVGKGLNPETARRVAEELMDHDALTAHLSAELNIDESDVVSPWNAALASAASFLTGAAFCRFSPSCCRLTCVAGSGDLRSGAHCPGADRKPRRVHRRRFQRPKPPPGWLSAGLWPWLRHLRSAGCSEPPASSN
jgi:hypothetical protein